MFTRARLRLTALYTGLLAITLAAVLGAMLVNATRETRDTDDLELRLRAEYVATSSTAWTASTTRPAWATA